MVQKYRLWVPYYEIDVDQLEIPEENTKKHCKHVTHELQGKSEEVGIVLLLEGKERC